MKHKSCLIVVTTDHSTKLKQAVLVPEVSAPHLVAFRLENLLMPERIAQIILMDNEKWISFYYFTAPCASMGTKTATATSTKIHL